MSASNGWAPLVPLGEVVRHRKEFIEIDDLTTYKRCRVQLHARGILLRDEVEGTTIKTKKQQVCRPDEFLVAEIDAKMGGFGIVPQELDGAIVSSHYFLFDPIREKLDPRFLGYYCRTHAFRDQVTARGTTNYAAIRPTHVLEYTIPLPPLEEQRRIVAKIERLAGKIAEARELSEAASAKRLAMLRATFRRLIEDASERPMSEVAPLVRRTVSVDVAGSYPELGVRCFGKGTFHKPALEGISVGNKKLYHIEPDDLVFSNVFSWEGAIAVAKDKDNGRVGSHRFITCVADPEVATPHFLQFYFLTPAGLYKIGEASPGGAGRNRTLGLKKLEAITVPIPSLEEQKWFDTLQAKVAEADRAQAKAVAKLEALLPSVLDRAFRGELSENDATATAIGSTTNQQLAKRAMVYTVMLLRHWSKPVARNVFDACLALMLNDHARKKILGNDSFQALSATSSSSSPLRGLDNLLGEMRARKAVKTTKRNGQQLLALGQQAPATDGAPTGDRKRLEETIAAFEIVGEDRATDVLSEMIDTTYELTAT